MTTRAKAPSVAAVSLLWREAQAGPGPTPPLTLEERLHGIEVMGQRIDGYIRFMCQVGSLNGISAEAKEKAVTAFYERIVVVESQLGRIQEDLQLE
jgi:hypothetical protein